MAGARERTAELWRGAMEDLIPAGAIRQRRSVAAAINPDGTIRGGAVMTILPWQRVDWFIPGTPVAGVNVGAEFRVIPGATLKRIDAITKRAPGATPFTAVVVRNATPIANVSIARGARAGESIVDESIASGALLRLDVTVAGGYGVTITAWLAPDLEDGT